MVGNIVQHVSVWNWDCAPSLITHSYFIEKLPNFAGIILIVRH